MDKVLCNAVTATAQEKRKVAITSYVEDNYKTATLTELASILGLSSEYLSRFIKQTFCKTFCQLLFDYRMSVAERLLLTTAMPVSAIILSVGYENKSYFHRRFKLKHSLTPSHYRIAKKA